MIREVTGDEIGTISLYEKSYGTDPRMMNAEERRRSAKERYSTNQYFREEMRLWFYNLYLMF